MVDVLVSTGDSVPGFENKSYVGFVWASSARAKDSITEFKALLRATAGGRIPEFESMMNKARNDVIDQLVKNAESKGANAVVGVRMGSTTIVGGTVEIFAYGTAVLVKRKSKR